MVNDQNREDPMEFLLDFYGWDVQATYADSKDRVVTPDGETEVFDILAGPFREAHWCHSSSSSSWIML